MLQDIKLFILDSHVLSIISRYRTTPRRWDYRTLSLLRLGSLHQPHSHLPPLLLPLTLSRMVVRGHLIHRQPQSLEEVRVATATPIPLPRPDWITRLRIQLE